MTIADRQVVLMLKTLVKVYNPLVNKWFKNESKMGTIRGELKQACLVLKDDSLLLVIARLIFFYIVIGYFKQGLGNFYGSRFDKELDASKHPQLFMYFSQDAASVPDNLSRIDKEKSVRMLKINQSVTKSQLVALSRKIQAAFVVNNVGWTYTTGKIAASYLDPDNGFYRGNYVLVNSEQDGVDVYRKICDILDVPFENNNLTFSEPNKPSKNTTSNTVNIAGKKFKEKRYRPVANVRFRYAYLSFGGTIPPFYLLDLTGKNFTVRDDV